MAGGMSDRRGVPLKDRVRPDAPTPPASAPPAAAGPIKPCWVTDTGGRLPALLLEWRRTESGFQGRVVRPVLEDGDWIVVEEWLPAGLLDPA
jgi:hypothetical protein